MPDYHDPVRHSESLSQAYAQDKRPLGVFLTAGCPYAVKVNGKPLAPDIAGLTRQVEVGLTAGDAREKFTLARQTLIDDGFSTPNIEQILTRIRSLHQVAGNGEVRGFSADDLSKLDEEISSQIVRIVDVALPDVATPFDHLAKWIGSTLRAFPVELFTTNYDLLIEQALERSRIPFFDGFVGSRQPFFDQRAIEEDSLPARWARVWKLHGSINWRIDSSNDTIRVERPFELGDRRPLIHPSHLKYSESRRMPYLAMIDQMRAFLRQPSAVLVVCGYSFSDDHLNEVLLQGAQSNSSAIVFALQFGSLAGYGPAVGLADQCSNLNLFADDEAIIGTVRAPWKMPQTAGLSKEQFSTFWNSTGNEEGELISGQFLLGDFQQFGKFLAILASISLS